MKRFSRANINTPDYWDAQYEKRDVDFAHILRQEKYLALIKGNPSRVIELGCGMSAFCPMAAERFEEVWGLDFAPQTIQRLQRKFPNVRYCVGDACQTQFPREYFDVVVAGELIEHLENPADLILEMVRICKRGGQMILSTPHTEFDDPEHLWEFSEADLRIMLSQFGKTYIEKADSKLFRGRSYIFAACIKSK